MRHLRSIALAGICFLGISCHPATSPITSIQESRAHIRAQWSRDGATIAFEAIINQVQGLYLVDTSGANLRLLHASANVKGSTWSPDSRYLVYSDSGSLYRITVQGDSITRLTSSGADIRPAWSLDGTKIAFVRNSDVYLLTLATDSVTDIVAGADFPTWNAGGQFLCLQYQYAGGGYYAYYFLTVQPDSSYGNYVYTFTDYGDCHYVVVNPVGPSPTDITFAFRPFDGYTQIWVVSVSSGANLQLTGNGGDYPSYSPDGTRIVYTKTQNGDGALWIINRDGTSDHRLTSPTS